MQDAVHETETRRPWQHVITAFTFTHSANRMDVAAPGPRAECALKGFRDRKDQDRARNQDTRSCGHENNDESVQLCEEEEGEAGPPQLVRQNRLS